MTYEAEVQFKFDATYTPTYKGFGSTVEADYIPEEHYLITAPATDLNSTQYFKLFEKFLLCVGMCPSSIRSGAMSLVFNDYVDEKEQRKICKEYELTMDEDLEKKYQEYKERDAEWTKMNIHYKKTFGSETKIKDDWEPMTEEQQELYDIVSDWWDKIFTEPTKGRSACIIDLVNSIIASKKK